ncbi:hypothetical protein Afil01_45990 [Actinorhabdospora filicis]|uniref:Uncharacterized protein n=1 Tax=Actinorhabdospora filicis TaxID=1785913 RepID=A0A9W6W4Y9_9ACTN|nr:hypothetical protein [Actinorhabdospora filicis]GLZ79792.1 hypothetical protein Afil01_45990 [Actinorhabdospora filicis]
MSAPWTLLDAGGARVAELCVTGGDFPWLHGTIRPLPGFGPWAELPEVSDESVPPLSLVDDEGEAVTGFWIVRHGPAEVGWRFY